LSRRCLSSLPFISPLSLSILPLPLLLLSLSHSLTLVVYNANCVFALTCTLVSEVCLHILLFLPFAFLVCFPLPNSSILCFLSHLLFLHRSVVCICTFYHSRWYLQALPVSLSPNRFQTFCEIIMVDLGFFHLVYCFHPMSSN
jgi:hypothetical protein